MAERRSQLFQSLGPLPVLVPLLVFAVIAIAAGRSCGKVHASLEETLADLKPVHAGVSVSGQPVTWLRRLAAGDRVKLDADGRARLRLDDGTRVVLDRNTEIRVEKRGITLEGGRAHVTSPVGSRSEIQLGKVSLILNGSSAGIERRAATVRVYSIDGELTAQALGIEHRVGAGQSLRLEGDKVTVAPERVYDDWTFGLASPWAARGAPKSAVGELWGRSDAEAGAAGSPLTIRTHSVNATIDGEVARTRTETTFFNSGSEAVRGDFRMALPAGAITSRFAVERDGKLEEGHIALASRTETLPLPTPLGTLLEWAGDGWLRGGVAAIAPGQTVKILVEYVEWLSPRERRDNVVLEYRYPLAGNGEAPLIGEFSARVDATPSSPVALSAGFGATNDGHVVEVRRSDFRPSADWVVTVERHRAQQRARLYVAPKDSNEAGSAVLLRTELPPLPASDGVTLALVVDTSGSMDPALLEAERSLVDALLAGLGARDRVVVLAADQTTRALGPTELGPVDAARRQAIRAAMSALGPGGATDLGRALEAAADALPADAPASMVVYIGDGWPTLGDATPEAIRARLARRAAGAPRISAVAVGPLSNRRLLASLTRGTGPLFEIADGADAARVAIDLMSDALRPALAGVEVDLGPDVDQVYPRTPRAIAAGETLTAVGRIRGKTPSRVRVRYRDARGVHEEVRDVEVFRSDFGGDVRRRWAEERVEETVLRGQGREVATQVALEAGLVTPWTAWVTWSDPTYVPTQLEARVLDLTADGESALGPVVATPATLHGALSGPELGTDSDVDLAGSVRAAVERALDASLPAVRTCRDSRAALRPELSGALEVKLTVDGDGFPHDVRVRGATPQANDDALNRCVALVVEGQRFPASGVTGRVKVERLIQLPTPPRALGARRCSEVSKLPMALRRGAWWSRLSLALPTDVYLDAKRRCELPTWTDRRALLELVLLTQEDGVKRVELAEHLALEGESDAAALLRREAVRRVRSPEEREAVRQALLGTERYPGSVFETRYRAAASDEERLAVVRQFLALAPHDSRLRRRLVVLLSSLGRNAEIVELTRQLRTDPFADALLLVDAASALRKAGAAVEAERTFGELAERAPRDPWVRGLLGDRLRAEGLFEQATAAYAVLEELVPDDGRAVIRSALAHAGAGRLDVAERLLLRVAQTGGRSGDGDLGEVARQLGRVLCAEALEKGGSPTPREAASLRRRARELSQAETRTILLARSDPGTPEIQVALLRGNGKLLERRTPDIAVPSLGLYLFRVSTPADSAAEPLKLSFSRARALSPSPPHHVRLDVLSPTRGDDPPRASQADITLKGDESVLEVPAKS